jgi:hypothetical protein
MRWKGGNAEKLLAINGLRWPVATDGKHIQIGCECHAVNEWLAFDDAQIVKMDGKDALRFWRDFKPTVMAMARYRAEFEIFTDTMRAERAAIDAAMERNERE